MRFSTLAAFECREEKSLVFYDRTAERRAVLGTCEIRFFAGRVKRVPGLDVLIA